MDDHIIIIIGAIVAFILAIGLSIWSLSWEDLDYPDVLMEVLNKAIKRKL